MWIPLRQDHLDALESKRLRAIGSESQQPQPPPMATPAHVLRLLPSETPLPRIASSVQRVLDSLRLSADLHAPRPEACSKISASEMVSQKKACIAKCNRGTATLALHCSLCGGAVSSSGIVIVGRTAMETMNPQIKLERRIAEADEVRLALDWQGFVVDSVEVESLVHEVGQRKGLNQHEFLTFMRKYRDFEVQKFMQLNEKLTSHGENMVTLADLPRLYSAPDVGWAGCCSFQRM
eukprot:s2067_g4.t1